MRRSEQRDKQVSINGKTFELERRLIENGRGVDTHWIFPIREHSDKVIVMGINAAILGLEMAEAATQTSLVPIAHVNVIASSGKCALIERLMTSVDEWNWASTDAVLDSDDHPVIEQVAGLLRALGKQPKTPVFMEKDFKFNASHELKLQYPLAEGSKYELDRIINLAYKASNHRLAVFSALLRQSGLAQHPIMDFFQSIVEDTLRVDSRGVEKSRYGQDC